MCIILVVIIVKNYFYSFIPLFNVFSVIIALKETKTVPLTSLNFFNYNAPAFDFFIQVSVPSHGAGKKLMSMSVILQQVHVLVLVPVYLVQILVVPV